ncbi:MAG: hypothetical protein GEV08_07765 [Acidimicrobiia bacterium]|nr:hypothetical protein [Acidimicrobiia bacterium]
MAGLVSQEDVLEAVRLDPRRSIDRGKLQFLAAKCSGKLSGQPQVNQPGIKLREYIAAKLERYDVEDEPAGYRLPWARSATTAAVIRGSQETKALEPSDILWISRLPTEPDKVADADVERLAALALATPVRSSDRHLVDSVLAPVRAHHERRAAEADLSNAKRYARPVDASTSITNHAASALSQIIKADEPNLYADEAGVRALRQINEVVEQDASARVARVEQAEQRLADLSSHPESLQAAG